MVRDADGRPLHWQGVTLDISDQKQAEAALREAETKYRTLVEQVPAVVYVGSSDAAASCGYVSPQIETMLGYTVEEYLSDPAFWWRAIHPDDRDRVLAEAARCREAREPFRLEYRKVAGDGRVVWIRDEAVVVRDERGAPLYTQGINLDISERKRAEEDLARLAAIVESSQDAIFSRTLDGTITTWNAAAERLYGYASEEAIGRPITMLVPPEHEAERRLLVDRVARGEPIASYDTVRLRKDGTRVAVAISMSPIHDRTGTVVGVSAIARDVGERKRLEANQRLLADLDDRLRLLTDPDEIGSTALALLGAHIGDVRALFVELDDPSGEMVVRREWRPSGVPWAEASLAEPITLAAETATALRAVLVSGQSVTIADVADDPRTVASAAALAGRGVAAAVVVPVVRAGRCAAGLVLTSPVARDWQRDEVALVTEVAGRIWPLIERARFVSALRDSEERLRLALETAHLATWDWDLTSGEIRSTDWERWRGGPSPPQHRSTYPDFLAGLHPADRARVDQAVTAALLGGDDYAAEYRVMQPDGIVRWKLALGRVERDGDGREGRLHGVELDITDRKEAEETLRAATAAAEQVSRLKSAILSAVTHELRTPLASVQGYLELMLTGETGELAPEQAEFVEIAHKNARHLNTLINDLLDLVRIAAGELDLKLEPVAVEAAVDRVRQVMLPRIVAKGLTLTIDIAENTPPLLADRERVHQILLHLTTNAVKFTERGEVTIRASSRPLAVPGEAAEAAETVAIAVSDTGVGIAPEVLPQLFEEFRQADGGMVRRHGGLGLGLAITRKLAELQGGRLTVESEPGIGSTFTVYLPATPSTTR